MQVALDRASHTPIFRQIEGQFRALILAGRLPPGFRLPSERVLSQQLRVNRTTVVNAYRELAADGLVEGHVGRGTQVLGPASVAEEEGSICLPLTWGGLVRSRQQESPLAQRVASIAAQSGVVSLASGVADTVHSPHLRLAEAVQAVLTGGGQDLLSDSPTEGLVSLRQELALRLTMKGCSKASAKQVFILSGSQQGLYLVAQLLLQPGDAVLVESPTYLGALEVFRAVGARLVGVPMDEQGMQVRAAERVMAHAGIRLIYTIPNFQNPTGVTMSGERRVQLLALAQRYQVPILEDDLYGELSYGTSPPAPIRALDTNGYVLYLGSLSPVLGSGLRLGWLLAPPGIAQPLLALRQTMDLHPNNFVQAVVEQLFSDGSLDAHLQWVRQTYGRRRDAMLAALERHVGTAMQWTSPEGGFYVWCTIPEAVSGREILEAAAAEGVALVPGELFYPSGSGDASFRLSFAHPLETEIEEGVRRLARALRSLRTGSRQRARPHRAGGPVV
ncbi:MAG: MocR-like pyridoxine biosynthesis transcription factor PdxR [Anaerolineae bacterium]